MWYVLQVESGQEENMRELVAKALADVVPCELFVPKYTCMWKVHGEWIVTSRTLFPGYLFLDFDGEHDEETKKNVLKRLWVFVEKKVEPVCIGGGFYPIHPEEQEFLIGMMNAQHEVGNSVGDLIGGSLVVHTGPLKGREGLVARYDRHKRFGLVRTSLWGEERMMKVGLAVVSKVG